MDQIPMIRVELDGIRRQVALLFRDHENELTRMVESTLSETLTENWVAQQVKESVHLAVVAAINDVSNNFALRKTLEEAMVRQLQRKIDGI